eukprot:1156477-Pelagomonas_calceolata.AAC.4
MLIALFEPVHSKPADNPETWPKDKKSMYGVSKGVTADLLDSVAVLEENSCASTSMLALTHMCWYKERVAL